MAYKPETPFDSIEGALEYVSLLVETVEETQADITSELADAKGDGARGARRADALQIVAYKLERLASHARASRHSLSTVRGDTPSVSAVSSMLSPAKKRSMTT